MKDELLRLEKLSRQLEPNAENRAGVRDEVVSYSETFLNSIESIKTFNFSETKGAALLDSPILETGIAIDEAIDLIRENVDAPGLNPASGGHLAYIPGGGIYYAALGDYWPTYSTGTRVFFTRRRVRCGWRICSSAGCATMSGIRRIAREPYDKR